MTNVEYSLILGGGGAKTLTQIAFLEKLEDLHIPLKYIAGTSMGALHAVLIAMGYKAKDIYQFYIKYKKTDLFSFSLGLDHIMTNKKLGKIIDEICQKHNYKNLQDLPIKTAICVTDNETGEAIFLTKGSIKEAVLASSATIFCKKIVPRDLDIINQVIKQSKRSLNNTRSIKLKDGCYSANVPFESLDIYKEKNGNYFDICLDCVPTYKSYHFLQLDRFNKAVYKHDQERRKSFINKKNGLYVELECGLSQVGFSKKNLDKAYKYVDHIFNKDLKKKILCE